MTPEGLALDAGTKTPVSGADAAPREEDRLLRYLDGRAAPPPKLYKIGEVIRHSGVSRQTLHNYTMMGLIGAAGRTESGHRLYPEAVFARLARIAMLKRHRTLREVKELLDAERPN
jgi:hypothetical protein